MKLSVVIPVYNEEKRFKKGFSSYYSYLSEQKYPWELIIVDDGSKDKTLEIARHVAADKKNIRIISYKPNKGKGHAIAKGVMTAKGKYILFADIDHSVPIKTVDEFFKHFKNNAQVVIGSRRIKDSRILVHQPKLREFLGRGFTLLVNILIYPGVKDSTCGFKAFEKDTARKIFKRITVYDWAFDAELLYICKKKKTRLIQAPVTWSDVRGSKVSLKKDVARSLKGLLKIRLNSLSGKYD